MNVCIAATGLQKEQLLTKGIAPSAVITWVSRTEDLLLFDAESYIDCTFNGNALLQTDKPFLFHSPVHTLSGMQAKGRQGRFCAWNTFIERAVWEVALTDIADHTWISKLMDALGWRFCIVKDEPGFIAPRIIAGIINEANYALQAGISTREEIDLAMKLGTNYPYGPFEWADKIGSNQVEALLEKLNN